MILIRILLRRLLQLVFLLALLTAATFLLSSLIPGDFFSQRGLDPGVRAASLEELRRAEGLDLSAAAQYARWLRGLGRLDFGRSLFYGTAVTQVIVSAIANTLWIGLPALLAGVGLGVIVGTLHAGMEGRVGGRLLDALSAGTLSLPTLLLGLFGLLLAVKSRLFPTGGVNSIDAGSGAAWLIDRLHHATLPALCLAVPVFATVERLQQAAAAQLRERPFHRSARGRGVRGLRLFVHYRLRPALNPVVSNGGPIMAGVLSGSLVLEVLFAWPGLGKVTYDALFNRDTPLLLGCVIAASVLLVFGNLAADLLLTVLDPRTRHREAGGP